MVLAAGVLGTATLALSTLPAGAVGLITRTFDYNGGPQSFVVPPGVTTATFTVAGAQGGANDRLPLDVFLGGFSKDPGARGGSVTATIPVSPGETLQINVGGTNGFNGGGLPGGCNSIPSPPGLPCHGTQLQPVDTSGLLTYSAGGVGGGASDVRQAGNGLNDRVIVAGGGGGRGGFGDSKESGVGGVGASPSGGDASLEIPTCPCMDYGKPGSGGGTTAGGAAGLRGPDYGPFGGFADGRAGAAGSGGNGGTVDDGLDVFLPTQLFPSGQPVFVNGGSGGGGGGGWYGGGGGGAGFVSTNIFFSLLPFFEFGGDPGGGGGGGSSHGPPGATFANGTQNGNGQVTVTYAQTTPTLT